MMDLYASPTSPYARIVRLVLAQKQLGDRVTEHLLDPWQSPPELLAVNPVCRVPTLVTDEGTALTEAAVIVLYLERRFPEPRLIPREDIEVNHARLGLALGALDSGVGVFLERRFGDPTTKLAERRLKGLRRSTVALVDTIDTARAGQPDLGDIATVVALTWLEFRLSAELDWRAGNPAAVEWLAQMNSLPAFAETMPPDA